jgi:hypothetical protein
VPPGERVFVVTVQSGEEVQRFLLIANVKEQPVEDKSIFVVFGFKVVLITLLVVLFIIALAVGAAKYITSVKKEAGNKYY